MKKIFIISVIFLMIFAGRLNAFAAGREEAAAKLKQMNIAFSEAGFINSVYKNQPDIVELFIKAGINIDAKDKNGYTALMHAASGGYEKIVKMLVEGGANAGAVAPNGATAMSFARNKKNLNIVKLLQTPQAPPQKIEPPNVKRHANLSIPFGSGKEQITRYFAYPEGRSKKSGPSAYAADRAGNIYVVDDILHKVMRIDAENNKVSTLFSYDKTPIGEKHVSSIAVSGKGIIYLACPVNGDITAFKPDGTEHLDIPICCSGTPSRIIIDGSDNLAALISESNTVDLFDNSGAPLKKVKFTSGKINGICPYQSKVFVSTIDKTEIKIANLENPAEILLKYSYEGDAVSVGGAFIGIGSRGNIYHQIAASDAGDNCKENFIAEFSKDGKLEKKYDIPSSPDEEVLMPDPFILAPGDAIISYIDDGRALNFNYIGPSTSGALKTPQACLDEGDKLLDGKKYDQAITLFDMGLKQDPPSKMKYDLLMGKGHCQSMLAKDFDGVISCYQQALKINPESAKAWFFIGMAYRMKSDYKKALQAFETCLKYNPSPELKYCAEDFIKNSSDSGSKLSKPSGR